MKTKEFKEIEDAIRKLVAGEFYDWGIFRIIKFEDGYEIYHITDAEESDPDPKLQAQTVEEIMDYLEIE